MQREANDPYEDDQALDALEQSEAHDAHTHSPATALNAQQLERAAALFRAAGDPARLALLQLLGSGERCVSELAGALGEQMSTISQRLKHLRTAHLVRRRRDGKHIYYRLADSHIAALIQSALDHAAEP